MCRQKKSANSGFAKIGPPRRNHIYAYVYTVRTRACYRLTGLARTLPDRKFAALSICAPGHRLYHEQSPSAGETVTCMHRAHAPQSAAHSSTAAAHVARPASLTR